MKGDPSNCPDLRGKVFNTNQSSSWKDIGLYQLGLFEESLLGYSGNADFGYDNVNLGWPGTSLPSLNHQVIEGFATKDFFLGTIGLTPHAVNLSTFNDPQPSVLAALRNASNIPSSSWGYTAGAYYQSPKVFGSLTLGGYDTTRAAAPNVSVPFGADISRDLLVGVQSITTDIVNTPLLTTGIYALIDSLVPDLWLPLSVCTAFEQAFGLQWNDTAGFYPVNDTLHSRLTLLNPNVTFTLGASATQGNSVTIVMPYGSFDLTASAPLVNNQTRYFPLQRAQNDTQYTLGRAFLQQAYVFVDYDRSSFTVSQALFPSTEVSSNLVSIYAPGTGPTSNSTSDVSSSTSSHSKTLGSGAVAGVVVAAVIVILAIVGVTTFIVLRRRRRQRAVAQAEEEQRNADVESKVDQQGNVFAKAELDSEGQRIELDDSDSKPLGFKGTPHSELGTYFAPKHELGSPESTPQHEMPAGTTGYNTHELPSPSTGMIHEMPTNEARPRAISPLSSGSGVDSTVPMSPTTEASTQYMSPVTDSTLPMSPTTVASTQYMSPVTDSTLPMSPITEHSTQYMSPVTDSTLPMSPTDYR